MKRPDDLRGLEIPELEEHDRQGYVRAPQGSEESLAWESEAAWPAE